VALPPTVPPRPLFGRESVLADLAGAIDRAAAGRGGSLALVADAGVGKTSLLAHAVAHAAERSMTVLSAAGIDGGVDLPWEALAALCLPLRERFGQLPTPQAAALEVAFALTDSPEPADGLAVALGLHGSLSDLAAERPLLVVVDDLHWVDRESRRALEFVAGRIQQDRIFILTASRPSGVLPAAAVELMPLEPPALDALLLDAGVRSAGARREIGKVVDGNPLQAIQLARTLDADEQAGRRPVHAPLPVPTVLEGLYADRLARLPEQTIEALLLVALDLGEGATVVPLLSRAGSTVAHLEPAEELGLVEMSAEGISFTHPVVRSAVYHRATPRARREAHLQLASLLGPGSPRGVAHRAAAAVGPDDDLAADLAQLASESMRRGAPMAASERYHQAGRSASVPARRADHLVSAAGAALLAGAHQWVRGLLDEAAEADPQRTRALDARRLEVRLAVGDGRYREAKALALETDRAMSGAEPVAVAEVLIEVARTLLPIDPLEAVDLCDRVWALAQDAPAPASLYAEIIYSGGRFVRFDPAAGGHVERWPELLELEGPVVAGPFLAETVARYYSVLGRTADALALLDAIEPAVRASSASSALVPILATRGHVLYSVDLRASVAASVRAWDLADAVGSTGLAPAALHAMAMAAAAIGDEELVERAAATCAASGSSVGIAYASAGRARLHLANARHDRAAEEFDRLRSVFGRQNLTICRFEGDEVEALVRSGRADEARDLLPTLEAASRNGPWARGQLWRAQAMLTDDIDAADGLFARAAGELAGTNHQVAHAMNELSWGERLRRAKRRAAARQHLQRALDGFSRIGASAYRRRCADELVLAGGSDPSRPIDEILGSIEMEVARRAAAGATNREIAAELFLSPRTIENHLGAVYRKLGVSGRAELAGRDGLALAR